MSDDVITKARIDAIEGRYAPPSGVWARRLYDESYGRELSDIQRRKVGAK